MKKLLTLLLLIASITIYSQQNTFEVEGTSAKHIIKKSKVWIAENIKDSKLVTELEEENTIVFNGIYAPEVKNVWGVKLNYGYLEFVLKIEAKDGKYRTTYSNFYHKSVDPKLKDGGPLEADKPKGGLYGIQKKIWNEYKEKVPKYVSESEKSLYESIKEGKSKEW